MHLGCHGAEGICNTCFQNVDRGEKFEAAATTGISHSGSSSKGKERDHGQTSDLGREDLHSKTGIKIMAQFFLFSFM